MKMKSSVKSTAVALIAVGLILLAPSAHAQVVAIPVNGGGGSGGQSYENAETLAQAFLLHDTDHYTAYGWSYNRDSGTSIGMDMVLDQNLFITNMTINNTNIPLPQPLAGVPVPSAGYQDFYVQITAVDKNGNPAAQGQFQTNYLAQGGLISISMTPQFPPAAIQLPRGLDAGTLTVTIDSGFNGWGWSYDPTTGLLTINVSDPSSTDVGYTVTDGSGGLLAHGTLPFFQSSPGAGTGTNSVFDLHNDGGYVVMPLGTNGYNYQMSLPFDSDVVRSNQWVSAKVIGVPDVGYQSKLYISSYNLNGGTIEVRKWSATGAMDILPCSVSNDQYGGTTVMTSNYVNRVVVTVLPGQNSHNRFYLYVARTY
jgi:hypothetical protein